MRATPLQDSPCRGQQFKYRVKTALQKAGDPSTKSTHHQIPCGTHSLGNQLRQKGAAPPHRAQEHVAIKQDVQRHLEKSLQGEQQ
mmetsp:Transcript_22776/g.40721  ORF Transcript_22776/g.40721 Transcript_22776/m.40721 type:complete len:85 (-) Transcript_22776:1003-1257(-)